MRDLSDSLLQQMIFFQNLGSSLKKFFCFVIRVL